MPLGFKQHSSNRKFKVLSLKKNRYGLHQKISLTETLSSCGLTQAHFDHYLFIGKKSLVITICHVDNLIFWARIEKDISDFTVQLHPEGVDIEQEDYAAEFPRVYIK